ncbi:hypothetical protein LJR290_002319 [Variovorax sp. LjRoot290]|uniref:hypothetical protein n=1 Tax=unclassified Variovorax TaxID=663243 RepID=UPI0008886CC1|nr:hypothetical protein [Variovorax sp. CF079]SDE00374.1 hypothetical protein SAMN05444679_11614 [Variovorax sp. CF079]
MNRKTHLWSASLLAAVVLAGCGGGGGGGSGGFPIGTAPPPSNPPPVMTDPYDAFIAYVKGLIDMALDTAEPADVAAFDPPPTSDTKDPLSTQ